MRWLFVIALVFLSPVASLAQVPSGTGGDIFNVNPGGPAGTPPPQQPGGDQFNTHPNCRETGWFSSPDGAERWRWLMVPTPQAPQFQSFISTPDGQVSVHDCTDRCSATAWLCLVLQATPHRIPRPPTSGTDCPTVLAAARAAAASIQAGNTRPDAIINLTKTLQQCPPAYPRPIDCFDMMVNAQSKLRTNPDFSKRRAQQALECYEGRRPDFRQPTQRPQSGYACANGVAPSGGPSQRPKPRSDLKIDRM